MINAKLDRLDREILYALQLDSQRPVADIGREIGLSPSACHRRIKLLEQRGVLIGYHASLNRSELGYALEFFVHITLSTQAEDALKEFENAVSLVPEVLECHLMTGTPDYQLRIVSRDVTEFEEIHRARLTALPNVSRIESSLALRTVKPWAGYPVEAL